MIFTFDNKEVFLCLLMNVKFEGQLFLELMHELSINVPFKARLKWLIHRKHENLIFITQIGNTYSVPFIIKLLKVLCFAL